MSGGRTLAPALHRAEASAPIVERGPFYTTRRARERRLADRGDIAGIGRGAAFEDRRSGDQVIGAGGGHGAGRFRPDAAVDLDFDVASAGHLAHGRGSCRARRR